MTVGKTSQLPWPDSYLTAASWPGIRRALDRFQRLASLDALPATLMLVGEAGFGREGLAIELAATLVCRLDSNPGCSCGSCERVRRGIHPDVEIIDLLPGKTRILIEEQIRPMVAGIDQHPFEGRRRVVIIGSAHQPPLSEESASALLKTLEEPPPHATILLLASNPARSLPTIVSRSVLVRVPRPLPDEVVAMLAAHHGLERDQAAELLLAAGGDPVLALTAGAEGLREGAQLVDALQTDVLDGDGLAVLRLAALAKRTPEWANLIAGSLLRSAAAASASRREEMLVAAATLLAAERRRLALNIDVENAVVGALAPLAARAVKGS